MQVVSYDPKTGEVVIKLKLSTPRPPAQGKTLHMCCSSGGFRELPGAAIVIDERPLTFNIMAGYKK